MQIGGIILCGGESKRMGTRKPWLLFGGQTVLERVVQTLSAVVRPVVVVSAAGQALPPLAGDVILSHDRAPGRGPLEGVAVGLAALVGHADAAFVCGCDAALLSSNVVQRLCSFLREHDAVVPIVGGIWQTLTSVCRTSALQAVEAMLESGERATHRLFDRIDTRFLSEEELREIDPALDCVRSMNTPAEYLAALAAAGFPAPE